MKKSKRLVERLCAVLLALLVAFTTVIPQSAIIVSADDPVIAGEDDPGVTPTPEVTPEATPEATPTPETTPEATPTPETTPEATPTPETTPTPTEAPAEKITVTFSLGGLRDGVTATITIKDSAATVVQEVTGITTFASVELDKDNYTYEISATGYKTKSGSITDSEAVSQTVDVPMEVADVDTLILSPEQIALTLGDKPSAQINVNFSPEGSGFGKTVTYTSSNTGVATVDGNGKVTAKGAGTTEISATTGSVTSNSVTVTVAKKTIESLVLTVTNQIKEGTIPILQIPYSYRTGVELKVSGVPTGDDAKFTYYYMDGSDRIVIKENEPATSITWSNIPWKFAGKEIEFGIEYSSPTYQVSSNPTAKSANKKHQQSIDFKENVDGSKETQPYVVTKTAKEQDITEIIKSSVDYDGELLFALETAYADKGIVVSDDKKTVKVTTTADSNHDLVKVLVSAAETDESVASEAIAFYVYVQTPVDLVAINEAGGLTNVTAEKTYDGTTALETITVSVSKDELKKYVYPADVDKITDVIQFTFKGTSTIEDCAQAQDTTFTLTSCTADLTVINDKVTVLDFSSISVAGKETINKRTINLGAEDVTVKYVTEDGKSVKTQVSQTENKVKVVGEAADETLIALLAKNGITLGSDGIITTFQVAVKDTAQDYLVGSYDKAVKPDVSEYTNFDFVCAEDNYGKLTVQNAAITIADLVFSSDHLYQNGSTVYTDGGNLKAQISSSIADRFGDGAYVAIIDDGVIGINLTADGYTSGKSETNQADKKLAVVKNGVILTDSVNCTIVEDYTDPTFKFGNLTENTEKSSIFNLFKPQTTFTMTGFESGDANSGVANWRYVVISENDDASTKAEIDAYLNGTSTDWTTGYDSSTLPDEIKEIKVADQEGNYIVVVNIRDNVGNEMTVTSNGLVLDYRAPKISITDADNAKINASTYYNSDVNFKVALEDQTTTSGFAAVRIRILDNGKVQGDPTIENYSNLGDSDLTAIFAEIDKDASKGVVDINVDKALTLAQINAQATKTIGGLTVSKDLDSNNLKIEVVAIDQAGNVSRATQALMIDNVDPTIAVQYASDASVLNDKYLKSARTMTITYTEKNFNSNGLKFDVLAGPNINTANPHTGITLAELGNYGITVSGITDSESSKDKSNYTNNRTNTVTLTFAADNEYYIVPHVTDLSGRTNGNSVTYSGNETETAKTTFVIDTTAPVLSTVFASGDGAFSGPAASASAKTRGAYSNQDVTATVTVTEKNFALTDGFSSETAVSFSNIKGTDGKSGDVTPSCIAVAEDAANWYGSNLDHSVVLRFAVGAAQTDANAQGAIVEDTTGEDANYVFTYTFTDLAGNSVTYTPEYFTADNDKPSGEYTVDGAPMWQKILNVLTFGIFKINTSTVSLSGSDVTAGVDTISYYKTTEYLTRSQFESLTDSDWTVGTSFSVSPNEQYVVYQRIVDKAGNVTYRYPANGIIEDNVGPIISLADASASSNGIHAGDVTVSVNVQDPVVGDTYSGIKYVWYMIESTTNQVNATPSERTAAYTLVDNTGNPIKDEANRTFNGNLVVPSSQFNSNDVTVTVYAEDFSGSVVSEQIKLKIDTTAPVIENISWNTSAASNGKYYNVTRIATFTVRERNFDINQVRFNITNTDGTMPAISSWSVDASGTSDDNINTVTVTFSADGDYNMNLSVTDLAGNASNTITAEEFTIDKTAPTISVTFDNNDVRNGKYYNATRTATITVNEHNFSSSDVRTAITASDETPTVGGWTSRNNINTATVPFTAEGDYSFVVNYTDLAGNTATAYSVSEFTIDLTNPEVEIYDIVDKSANKGTVAPGVRTSDRNYDTEGVSIVYYGAKHESTNVDGTRTSIENGEDIKMADFAHTEDVDDVYTMTATVTDLAGNWTEKQVTFSVNRFGSNFIFSDDTQAFLDVYYNKEEADIVVTEINVDTLTKRDISSSHDSDITDLEEGTDYAVVESGSEVEWKSYQYTLDKSNFTEEGLYNLTFASTDAADNSVTNKTKDKNCEFVIDKTAPTAVIVGVEDGGQYRAAEREMEVALADNVAVGVVDLYIDGAKVASTDPESDAANIVELASSIPYVLASSNNWQTIKVVATDLAGNEVDTAIGADGTVTDGIRVLVTSNVLIQFYRNTPVFVITLIALILLILFLIFLFAKKRKKDEGAKKASTAAK